MKRMMHPQHGFHHAQDANDEQRMRTHGWVDDDPSALKRKLRDVVGGEVEAPRRRGKKAAEVTK